MNIGRNQLFRLPEGDCKLSAFKIFRKELVEIVVIAGKVLVVLHQVVVKRPVQHNLTFRRGINGVVDEDIGIFDRVGHPQGIGAEGQVIIPGQDAEDAVFLIQKVVVSGMPQIAVPVHHKNLHGEIPQHLVYVDGGFQIFAGGQGFQRLNHPLLIRL